MSPGASSTTEVFFDGVELPADAREESEPVDVVPGARERRGRVGDRARQLALRDVDPDADDEVIARLTAVPGIGAWSAQLFLIFSLQRPDVIASGDLGIRPAAMIAYGLPATPLSKSGSSAGWPTSTILTCSPSSATTRASGSGWAGRASWSSAWPRRRDYRCGARP